MSALRVAFAALLSLAPAALAWSTSANLDGLSMLGLAMVASIALAGLPALEREWLAPAICATWPAFALGAALDARAGAPWLALVPMLVWGALIVMALAVLSARGNPRASSSIYDVAWLAVVVAPPVLRYALSFGVDERSAPNAIEWLAQCSPLGWALERARAVAERPEYLPLGPCAAIALLAFARWNDARRMATT